MVLAPAHVFMYFWPDFNKYARNKKKTLEVCIVLRHTYYYDRRFS